MNKIKCATCNADLSFNESDSQIKCPYCRQITSIERKVKEVCPPKVEQNINTDIYDSIVTVSTNEGDGTAFIITSDGYAVTNAHVIHGDSKDVVAFVESQNKQYDAKLIATGVKEGLDLSIIKLEGANFKPLELTEETSLKLGEEVHTVGNARGFGVCLTKGYLSRHDFEGLVQLNIAMNVGNSGGPVFNSSNKVIGVATAIIEDYDGMGFAIGTTKVIDFIKQYKIKV